MPKYLLAHDLGTSGNKATLFTVDGMLVDSSVSGYNTRYYNGNWAEQNPADWWEAVCSSTKNLVKDIDAADICAVSFSGQMMGCLCLDKRGTPLYNSIIWADMRAQKEEKALVEKVGAREFFHISGHRPGASYSLAKYLWLRENAPDVYKNTYKILQAKDYMVYKLTGRFYTDYSDATGTNAFDISSFDWSDKVLDAVKVPREVFPDAVESTKVVGEVTEEAAALCGLKKGTPVVMGAGDGGCGALGAGCVESDMTYCCMGTSAWIAHVSDRVILDDEMKLVNWAHAVPGLISTNGTMQCAGTSYTWMKEHLCAEERFLAEQNGESVYTYIDKSIEKAAPGCNGLYYVPYLCGERCPRWDAYAKGGFYGLKIENTHDDMVRSIIEGIGYNMRLILDIMKGYADIRDISIMGGLVKSKVNLKIFADIFGKTLNTLNYFDEATSVGAAVLAGVGSGALKDFHEISKFSRIADTNAPDESNRAVYEKMLKCFDSTYYAMKEIYSGI
jgi:xylulokinase